MIRIAEDAGYDFELLRGVVTVNDEQFERVAEKAVEMVGGSVDGVRVGVWGLTFKARTDDLRESPALAVIGRLVRRAGDGPGVRPDGHAAGRRAQGRAVSRASRSSPTPYAACEGAEVLLVLTEWDEFKWLDFDKVAEMMAAPASGRRPQPARPRGAAPARLRVPRHRPRR